MGVGLTHFFLSGLASLKGVVSLGEGDCLKKGLTLSGFLESKDMYDTFPSLVFEVESVLPVLLTCTYISLLSELEPVLPVRREGFLHSAEVQYPLPNRDKRK